MTIQLNAEQEHVVEQAIEAGLIHTPEDIVEIGMEAIRQRLHARGAKASAMTADQWFRDFQFWVHSHSAAAPLLSDESISRESIYGTRGR